MNESVLLLDSTVLVAYERDLTRRAQAVVLEALADGRLLGVQHWSPRVIDCKRVFECATAEIDADAGNRWRGQGIQARNACCVSCGASRPGRDRPSIQDPSADQR